MTRRRTIAVAALCVFVIAVVACVGFVFWDRFAYIEHRGSRSWVHTVEAQPAIQFQHNPQYRILQAFDTEDAGYGTFGPVPRDGQSHEVRLLSLRWKWLPGEPDTVRILRSISRESFEQEFGVKVTDPAPASPRHSYSTPSSQKPNNSSRRGGGSGVRKLDGSK